MFKNRGKPAHRFRPISAVPRRQDFSIHGVTVSFGLGTSPTQRLATQRRTSTTPIRPTDVCFPILLDYEYPYASVPGASLGLTPKAERQALGTHRVAGGVERSRRPIFFLRFGVPRPPLWGISTARGVLFPERPTRPTSDALCRFSGSGFRWARVHAFAWALPGGSCQGPPTWRPVTGTKKRTIRERLPSIGAISHRRGSRPT